MTGDTKTLSILAHLLGLITGFLGPLILLLVTENKVVKNHARNALNWQISAIIYFIISFILVFVFVGFLLIFAVVILNVVFSIMAAVKAGDGKLWKYPLAISFLKLK